jgi:DNA-binding HxlR family transcriptional regulator
MGTGEKVKLRILAYLREIGEANASQLEKKAECANKTFLKVRRQLEQEGIIKKRYEPKPNGGVYAIYYIPEEKRREVETMLERENFKKVFCEKIDEASIEDIEFLKQKLAYVEKELLFFKAINRQAELEEKPLPAKAVQAKLLQMGFTMKDLSPNCWNEQDHIVGMASSDKILNVAIGPSFDFYEPEEIEIRLIPESEVTSKEKLERTVMLNYGSEWSILTLEPLKGYYIIGRYKEVERLHEYIFNLKSVFLEKLLHWQEKYNLTKEDFELIYPRIWDMMFMPEKVEEKIEKFIEKYLERKKRS